MEEEEAMRIAMASSVKHLGWDVTLVRQLAGLKQAKDRDIQEYTHRQLPPLDFWGQNSMKELVRLIFSIGFTLDSREVRDIPLQLLKMHQLLPDPIHSRIDIFKHLEDHMPRFYGSVRQREKRESWVRLIRCVGNICCYVSF